MTQQEQIASDRAAQQALPKGGSTPYVIAVVIMSLLMVLAILGIIVLRPNQDNTSLISTVVGSLLPTTLALLALMKGQETHLSVNSRLSEWKIEMLTRLEVATAHAHAEGVIVGQSKEAASGVVSTAAAVAAAAAAAVIASQNKPTQGPPAPAAPAEPLATAAAIEANTEATKDNTAATTALATAALNPPK